MWHKLFLAGHVAALIAAAFLLACFLPAPQAQTVKAADYTDLGLDSTDLAMMVEASDGYYYWVKMDVSSKSFWEIRFRMNGQTVTNQEIVRETSGLDLYRDNDGHYVFNGYDYWGNGHDVYTCIELIAALNGMYYHNGGAINVRLDYAGTLYAYSTSMPVNDLYIRGGQNRTVTIVNDIAPSESSWAGGKSAGFGSIFQLDNGTYQLRTRQLVFDGGDHYTSAISICSNCVYVADGCSYWSYGDEFLHGYSSAVISNHHSNTATTCYGESYVRIENAYFHDCLVGAVANNRLEICDSVFKNCTCAVSVSGTGGSQGGSATGGQNGLWDIYGSRVWIDHCTISGSAAKACCGVDPYGINISGNYVADTKDVSVTVKNTTLDTAERGINIEGLSGERNIRIEGCSVKNSYGTQSAGVYQNNTVGGVTSLIRTTISGNSPGVYNNAGSMDIAGGRITQNSWGIINGGTCNITGGAIDTNSGGGIYQSGTLNLSSEASVDANNRIYLTAGHIVDVSGPLATTECGKLDMADGDRKVGRILVSVDYTTDAATSITQTEKFSLWSSKVLYNADGTAFRGVEDSGTVRAAARLERTGSAYTTGIPDNCGFFSAAYSLTFDGNLSADSTETTVPAPLWFFWCEPTVYDLSVRAKTNQPFSSTGWALRKDALEPDYTGTVQLAWEDNRILYAVWKLNKARFLFYGNTNTGYEESILAEVSSDGIHTDAAGQQYFILSETEAFPDNPFSKEGDTGYSFVGWSMNRDTAYTSSGILAPGEALSGPQTASFAATAQQIIADGRMSYDSQGEMVFVYYAVWDKHPTLTTSDIYLYRQAVGKLTSEDLYAHIHAQDREDGALGSDHLSLAEFDPQKLLEESDRTEYVIDCSAFDGFGNRTDGCIRIHILNAQKLSDLSYVRFIDAVYLAKEEGQGGLMSNSKWRGDLLYGELEHAFAVLQEDSGYITCLNCPFSS